MKSNLSEDYIKQFQECLDAKLDSENCLYDPTFPWGTAKVVVLYLGLKKEKDTWGIRLPDGREARVFNINPGSVNRVAELMEEYSSAMEVGRTVFLSGGSVQEAVRKLVEFCDKNWDCPEWVDDPEIIEGLREEMEEYQMILAEDIKEMMERKCAAEVLYKKERAI